MLTKYAALDVLDARIAPSRGAGLMRTAHRVEFSYDPRPGYLYVRSRMISSRCNDNFDEFPAEEIERGWRSFIGKPVFVNHHNADHRKARGVIIDAALHKDANSDGSPDTWVEGLMEVDAHSYPKLAKAIMAGHIERTSMGVDVDYSICSKCGNKAQTPLDYCQHIPTMKGMKAAVKTASGQVRNEVIREKCYGLRFFENSLLVEDPADPTAFFLGKPEMGPSMPRTAKAKQFPDSHFDSDADTSGQKCSRWNCDKPATAKHTLGGKTHYACAAHEKEMNSSKESSVRNFHLGSMCGYCHGTDTITMHGSTECVGCGQIGPAGLIFEAKPRHEDPADHPFFQENPVHSDNIVGTFDKGNDDEHNQGHRWYPDGHLVAKALGSLHQGEEHPHGNTHMAAGMLANYSAQTGWEANQHNAARAIHEGKGIGGKGSGIFATARQRDTADKMLGGAPHHETLSPSAHKVRDFAHLLEHGGDADPANPRAVVDRHALSVATGKRMSDKDYGAFPKSSRHYYGHVVSAYHEAARKISEKTGETWHAHQVQAATWLTQQRLNQEGEQGETDDKKQRLNKGRERSRAKQTQQWNDFQNQHLPGLNGPGTGYSKQSARADMGSRLPFVREAYGETKAPPDVDTLRDEECPICGETDAYDGTECKVCGYVEPPKQFQDPNVDMAKQLDLRKNTADPAQMNGQDVGALEDALADPDRDGLDDETGEPIGGNVSEATLECPACGTQFPAEAPKSVETAPDPEEEAEAALGAPGDPTASPQAPEGMDDPQADPAAQPQEEGEVCPVCGKGVLTGAQEAEALTEEGPPPVDDEQAPEAETAEPGENELPDDEEPEDGPPKDSPFGESNDDSDEESDEESDDEEDEDKPVGKSPFPPKK